MPDARPQVEFNAPSFLAEKEKTQCLRDCFAFQIPPNEKDYFKNKLGLAASADSALDAKKNIEEILSSFSLSSNFNAQKKESSPCLAKIFSKKIQILSPKRKGITLASFAQADVIEIEIRGKLQ